MFGVHGCLYAQHVRPLSDAPSPVAGVNGHFHVDDSHYPAGGRLPRRLIYPGIEHVICDHRDALAHLKTGTLTQHAGVGGRDALGSKSGGVDPHAVHVGRKQVRGCVSRDGIETRECWLAQNLGWPPAETYDVAVVGCGAPARQAQHLGNGRRGDEVEPVSRLRPLAHVHVGIPETGHDPSAVEINHGVSALGHPSCPHGRGQRDRRGLADEVESRDHSVVDGNVDEVSQQTALARNSGVCQMQGHS